MNRTLLAIIVSSGLLLSTQAYAQTPDTVPPDNMLKAPVVESTGEQSVNLVWEPLKDNIGVVAYRVYYSETSYLSKTQSPDPTAQFARFKQVTQTRASIDGLTKGKKYYFTVTGLDAAGNESEYVATEAEAVVGTVGTPPSSPSPSPVVASPTPSPSNSPLATSTPLPSPSTAPIAMSEQEIRDLQLSFQRMAEKYNVTMEWKLPSEVTGNLAEILYQGSEGSPLAKLATLLPTATSYVVEQLAPGNYTFKVATVGPDGIESEGIAASVTLAATGPSALIAGLTALLAAVVLFRRRRRTGEG